jgi:hypothetical protein
MVRRIIRAPPAEARQEARVVQHNDRVPIRSLAIVRVAKDRFVFRVDGTLRAIEAMLGRTAAGVPHEPLVATRFRVTGRDEFS